MLAENTLEKLNQQLSDVQNSNKTDKSEIMFKLSSDNSFSNRQKRLRIITEYNSKLATVSAKIEKLRIEIQKLNEQLEKEGAK